jgi:hypothetical protein
VSLFVSVQLRRSLIRRGGSEMIVEMRLNGSFVFLIYENKIKKGFQKHSASCREKYSN